MVLSRSGTNLGAAISRSQWVRRAFCRKSQDCPAKTALSLAGTFPPLRPIWPPRRVPSVTKQRRGDTHKSFSKPKEALFKSTLGPPLGGIRIDPLNCANDTSLALGSWAGFRRSCVGSSRRLLRHSYGGTSKAG